MYQKQQTNNKNTRVWRKWSFWHSKYIRRKTWHPSFNLYDLLNYIYSLCSLMALLPQKNLIIKPFSITFLVLGNLYHWFNKLIVHCHSYYGPCWCFSPGNAGRPCTLDSCVASLHVLPLSFSASCTNMSSCGWWASIIFLHKHLFALYSLKFNQRDK